MGLILYQLLTLNPLFAAKSEARLLKEIQETNLEYAINEINHDFMLLKNLLRTMLVIDPTTRQSLDFVIDALYNVDEELVRKKKQVYTLPYIKRKPNEVME